ncbi:MAG: CorA family divalent cation transporter, partial [Shewanella sp.]
VSQGDTMKRLADWAALLAAPTLITSWYGMNFKFMPELEFKYSYGILFALVTATCLTLYWTLKKAKWL